MRKYELPEFLSGVISQAEYERWLTRKATTHLRRDRKRGNGVSTNEDYKVAIHQAVKDSHGKDAYTNERLDWTLVSKYNNAESQKRGREYKRELALLPSVDHLGDGQGKPEFRICSWRTNDAKSDLPYEEFVDLCKKVIAASIKH